MRNPTTSIAAATALALLVAAAGCAARVPYTAQPPFMPREEAERAIVDVIAGQPAGLAPSEIEVTDERLAVTRRNRRTVFYWERIAARDIVIHRDRGNVYSVQLQDAGARSLYRVWTVGLREAHRFGPPRRLECPGSYPARPWPSTAWAGVP